MAPDSQNARKPDVEILVYHCLFNEAYHFSFKIKYLRTRIPIVRTQLFWFREVTGSLCIS